MGFSPVDGSISLMVKRSVQANLPSARLPSARDSITKVLPTSPNGMTASGTTIASSNSGCTSKQNACAM